MSIARGLSLRPLPSAVALAVFTALAGLLAALAAPAPLAAEPTRLSVHVLSKGAKFVGSSMGGALVTVRDADTGELLASGETRGSTGDTARIMKEAHGRGAALSTPDAARFEAVLDLDRPRRLRIAATGPLAQRQATNEVSLTQWAVPGRHLDGGDGLLLELPGFVVDVLAPPIHQRLAGGTAQLEIAANVTMMCGCPITPGGLWDAGAYEVRAWIERDGERVGDLPLAYAGSASQFAARWTAPGSGTYEILVFAHDPANGNTGLDRTVVIVEP